MNHPASKATLDDLLADPLIPPGPLTDLEPVAPASAAPAAPRAVLRRPVQSSKLVAGELVEPEQNLPTLTTSAEPPAVNVTPAPISSTGQKVTPTPEQIRIAELEDLLARAKTEVLDKRLVTAAEPVYTSPPPVVNADELIHVVAADFTVLGATWYRGQEINIGANGSYDLTVDRNGDSWTTMTPEDQYDRFGEVKFAPGPWRGAKWDADAGRREAARSGGVPAL